MKFMGVTKTFFFCVICVTISAVALSVYSLSGHLRRFSGYLSGSVSWPGVAKVFTGKAEELLVGVADGGLKSTNSTRRTTTMQKILKRTMSDAVKTELTTTTAVSTTITGTTTMMKAVVNISADSAKSERAAEVSLARTQLQLNKSKSHKSGIVSSCFS